MNRYGLVLTLAMVALCGCKSDVATHDAVPAPQSSVSRNAPPQPVASPSQPQTHSPASQPPAAPTSPAKPPSALSAGPQFGWKTYDEESFAIAPLQGRFFVVPRNALRLRAELSSDSPVFAGLMKKADIKNKGVVNASNFSRLPCAFVKSRHGVQDCTVGLEESELFVLRDAREKPTQPVTDNKVKISLSVWACVAQCQPIAGDPK